MAPKVVKILQRRTPLTVAVAIDASALTGKTDDDLAAIVADVKRFEKALHDFKDEDD